MDIVLHPFGPIPGSSGLDFGIEVLNLSVYFTFPAALIAIFGAMLTLNSLKDGGIILLIASVIGMLGSIVPVSLASSVGAQCGFFPPPDPDYHLVVGSDDSNSGSPCIG